MKRWRQYTDPQSLGAALGDVLEPVGRRVEVVEQGVGFLEHLLAFIGQRKPLRTAQTERQLQALFKVGDVRGDGRLADAKHALRLGKTARFRNGPENLQQSEINIRKFHKRS